MQVLSRYYSIVVLSALMVFFLSCNNDTLDELPASDERAIWTGPTVTFEKIDGTDPNVEANQDRITDNVWITRSNDGVQIYNIRVESNPSKQDSPVGTLWAQGTIDNADGLEFQNFRDAVESPRTVVGKDLVALLVEDNILLSVRFTRWSDNKGGGFAYERSSQ